MISELEFLDKLRMTARPRPEGDSMEDLIEMIQLNWGAETKNSDDIRFRLEENTISHSRIFPGLFKYPGRAYFFNLGPEAQLAVADEDLCDNWVYDRGTQVLILNLFQGHHTGLMSKLLTAATGDHMSITGYERAEQYVQSGYGFYRSSASDWAEKGKEVTLNGQEKIVFKNAKFYRER